MTKTSVKINLDLGAGETIKIGSTPAIADVLPQCDLTDLATGAGVDRNWATFEPSGWLLDGNAHILPTTGNHIGVISGTISDGSGNFSVPPVLTITLGGVWTLVRGITLEFSEATGVFCNDLDIVFKNSGGGTIASQSYTPDGYEYFAELPTQPLANVKTIVITFNSTNEPYRHLRLVDLTYDTISFEGDEIQSAAIVEQVSPIAIETPANSLEFTVHSDAGDFSIVDPQGLFTWLERHQKMDVTETADGIEHFMGRFYLEEWDSENDKLARFEGVDALQILGTIPFADAGKLYYTPAAIPGSHVTIQQLVDDLETYTNFTFEVDASLQSIELTGVVPLGESVRSVLQNVCFAYGAFIDCSRSSAVQIKAMELAEDLTAFDYLLTNADIANRKIRQVPLVTGIKLTSHTYQDNSDHVDYQIYNGNIGLGFHRFLMPVDLLAFSTASSGTAVGTKDPQLLYADITVTSAGTLDWSVGQSKFHVRETYEQAAAGIPAGTPENILEIESAYFVTPDNVATVAQRVLDYYAQKFELEAGLFASEIAIGDSATVSTPKADKRLSGIVERADIDLAGGFRTKITARGNIDTVFTSGNKYDAGQTSHAGFTFSGTWSYALAASAYGGSVKFVATGQSGYAEFAFVGSQFKMIYSQLTDRGSVAVYVDGVLVATVSENGAETWQKEWTSPVFADGYHAVKLAHVETGGGAVTDLDAIEIL